VRLSGGSAIWVGAAATGTPVGEGKTTAAVGSTTTVNVGATVGNSVDAGLVVGDSIEVGLANGEASVAAVAKTVGELVSSASAVCAGAARALGKYR